jgi:sugar/nucleoside kinase (ribokinase family)
MRYASWSIIIDDIVFPDGRTAMAVLGGGGMYAVAGMRPWSDDCGILSNVGADFDVALLTGLAVSGAGLRRTARSTPRAWQLFEWNDHRTQIPRIPLDDWQIQLAWPHDLAAWATASGVQAIHLCTRGLPGDPALLAGLRAAGITLSLEPIIEEGLDRAAAAVVLECLQHVDIFSPGRQELRALLGTVTPQAGLRQLAALGPAIVALRQGAAGSLVHHRPSGRCVRVPAATARIVDVTGAGNAYSGGLLAAWCSSGDLRLAAASAAVSAALTLEQIGPPTFDATTLAAASARRDELLSHLTEVDGHDDE